MKKIKKYTMRTLFSLLLSALLFSSCSEDFFDAKPGDRIGPDEHYNTLIDAQISSIGAFGLLQDVAPDLVLSSMLRGDLVNVTENADQDMIELNRHDCSVDNKYIDPSGYYRVVISVNEALQYIEDIKNKDQDFSDIEYKVVHGNLVGLRSWAYLTLVRLYGEAAYFSDNVTELPDVEEMNYIPRQQMVDMLINDLDTLLDIDYLDDFYVWKMYNKAVMADLYMEKGNLDSAAHYLQVAIQGYENAFFKLDATYALETWQDIFKNSSGQVSTVMVAVPYSLDDNQENPLFQWTSPDFGYKVKPTPYIMNSFDAQVPVKLGPGDVYRGRGVSYTLIDSVKPVVNKYLIDDAVPASSHVILYRAADLHLMFAEVLNRMGDHEHALEIINLGYRTLPRWSRTEGVRGRVGLTEIVIPEGTADVTTYLEDIIMEERAMELAFEGKRWFDLMRVARRRGNNAYLANKVAEKFTDPNIASQVKNRLMNEENWYLPFKK